MEVPGVGGTDGYGLGGEGGSALSPNTGGGGARPSGGASGAGAAGGVGAAGGAASGATGGAASGGTGGAAGGGAGAGGSVAPASCDGDLDDGLIGFWRFEEGQGTRVHDTSGFGNHGTIVRGGTIASPVHDAPPWAPGRHGKALDLDGVEDWIRIPASASINSTAKTNAVSATVWIWSDSYRSNKDGLTGIVHRHEAGTRLERFGLRMRAGLPLASIHYFHTEGGDNVPLEEWVHMALTYDGSTLVLYMNGQEASVLRDVDWPLAADNAPLTIGSEVKEEDVIYHHIGFVDDVRLYNRALKPCEVKLTAR